jgi:hypothetical protein
MFKDLSPQAMLDGARRTRPRFLYEPRREIETYRTILAPNELGTATCYGAVVERRARRYWLFLERVSGPLLWQVGEFDTWLAVARWLARLHSRFATANLPRISDQQHKPEAPAREMRASPSLARRTGVAALSATPPAGDESGLALTPGQRRHLLRYDGDFYRLWMRRARTFLRRAEFSAQPRADRRRIDWLAKRYDRIVERLVRLPATFIHGEFFPSNILVQKTETPRSSRLTPRHPSPLRPSPLAARGEGMGVKGDQKTRRKLRICPVDWEMAAVGPGLIDLAALTAGKWKDEQKDALASAYRAALETAGGTPPTIDEFRTSLECCRLHLAVKMLGWSADWSPPPEHAQDWLSEALRLAENLGI